MECAEPSSDRPEGRIVTTLAKPNMMDFLKVCCRPQKDEVEQYKAMTGREWDVDAAAVELYDRGGEKFVLLDDDDEPIAVGGFENTVGGVWETWMLCVDGVWEQYGAELTQACNDTIQAMLDDGARRIQTTALLSRERACKWYVKGLRMKLESVADKFGVNGEDVACFVRFRE